MNLDHWLITFFALGAGFCFAIGYTKGHEHGKIAGRIALRKQQRALQQVSR